MIAENLCEIFFWVSAVLWAGGFWRLCTARAAFDFLQNALALLSSVTVLRLSGPKNQGPESQVPTLSKGSFGNSKAARAAPRLQSSAASQKRCFETMKNTPQSICGKRPGEKIGKRVFSIFFSIDFFRIYPYCIKFSKRIGFILNGPLHILESALSHPPI